MTSTKFALVRGRALRVTKTDGCGVPVPGPRSVVSTEGFISVGLTANNEEGETISVTNAAGNICILDEPAPKFTGYSIEVQFCGVDPELFSLMTGQPIVLDADGELAVGLQVNSDVDVNLSGFAMEMWSNVPVAACDASGSVSFGYMLIPFVKGGTLGDVTVENGAINFTLTGARSKDGNAWGVGPFDVVRDSSGDPSPLLIALPAKNHLHMQLTTVEPPAFTDGAASLGVKASGATAGKPGTPTPANTWFPETVAEMVGVTASPATAWTTGQYVELSGGGKAHWTGSAWAAGPA